jgi:WD40 repeat protein
MNTKTTRRFATAALVAAFTLPATPPAFAADPIVLPAGVACSDFILSLVGVGGEPLVREFKDKNGNVVRTISVGKGVVLTYTNIDTGKSVSIKTSGSVTSTVNNPDGTQTVTATGHNGLILFPTDIPAGPTTTQYVGRIVYNVDPVTGVFTLVSTSGQRRDICAELS